MSFGATSNIWQEFNAYEAVFWILCAAILLVVCKRVRLQYRGWLVFSAINVFLFGVTDVVEVYTGGFMHTAQWLFYWKAVHVVGLVVSVVWDLRLRSGK